MKAPDLNKVVERLTSSNRVVDDRVTRLREWGTDTIYPLLQQGAIVSQGQEYRIRRHVGQWWVKSLGSSRLWIDDSEQNAVVLTSGMEIGIGDRGKRITLVAESERWIALRGFCQRLLGWAADRQQTVDLTLRALRLARAHHAALLLRGDEELVPIAHALHRRVLGDKAPFVVCNHRRSTPASVRVPAGWPRADEAIAAAAGGTVCISDRRRPEGTFQALARLHQSQRDMQVYVALQRGRCELTLSGVMMVELPSFRSRESELSRIIDEYAADALTDLGASQECFRPEDHAWTAEQSLSFHDIENTTSRIVAARASRNILLAAKRLGIAPVSLTRWFRRRSDDALKCRLGSAVTHKVES